MHAERQQLEKPAKCCKSPCCQGEKKQKRGTQACRYPADSRVNSNI